MTDYQRNTSFFHIFRALAILPTLKLGYDFQILNADKLPAKGPAVLICKHQSWMDLFAICEAVYRPQKRQMYYLAKKELFENLFGDYKGSLWETLGEILLPFNRTGIKWMGAVPVDRDHPEKSLSTFKFFRKILDKDEFIVVFPEGRTFPGKMAEFKPGFINLMIKMQYKVKTRVKFVPVGISYGTGRIKKLVVNIGDYMTFEKPDCNHAMVLQKAVRNLTDFSL
ncbi:MAG: lysophospholipid acyltransferase family protein [Prolixibacteraceae bacterium]